VSITALFSGIFVVVGLADRFGRVKAVRIGFILSIVGSLPVGSTPSGSLAPVFLMLGRILQGLSGAFIMPASLALVEAYGDGASRQRAISLWSFGSRGGSGFAALSGGGPRCGRGCWPGVPTCSGPQPGAPLAGKLSSEGSST
jgi:DHA2 family multidrug resistance protein-like MFS transporter